MLQVVNGEFLGPVEHRLGAGQDRLHGANEVFEQAAAAAERAIDLLINAVLEEEIVDFDLLLPLADAVNAADPLLDLAGVPRQVVIDQGAGRLEVQTFAGGVVADEVANGALFEGFGDFLLRG